MTGAEKLRVPEKIAAEPEREKADWRLAAERAQREIPNGDVSGVSHRRR